MIKLINDFLNERKNKWLEPRLKKAVDDQAIALLEQEANVKFSFANWLPDAAKRAGQLSITTHPSKFTHTSARTTPINAQCAQKNDGYLRSGNVFISDVDASGNAAAMDVHSFLLLPISDTKNLLAAFEESNQELKDFIIDIGLDFQELKTGFLKMKLGDGVLKTDKLVKQVYFPVSDQEYHLLSLLTPSSMIWNLKKRINEIRFSDHVKQARLAKKEHKYGEGYSELYNLTVMGYGGTKPQVVSVLNNKNAGRSYLLPCIPPLFEKRAIRLPKTDFLTQSLYLKGEKKRFVDLHQWAKQNRNNIDVKETIQKIIQGIIDQVLYRSYQLRQGYAAGWSESEYYAELPLAQRIWLDDLYEESRCEEDEWRDEIAHQIASHMIAVYESINDATILGNDELLYIKNMINEKIKQDKEFF